MSGEVRIVITGDDKSAPVLDQLGRRLTNLEGHGKAAGLGMEGFARGVVGLTNSLERSFSVMTRLDLTQITLEMSSQRLTAAQEKLGAVVDEYGLGSEQAAAATRELARAQADLEKTQLRAQLSSVLVIGQVVEMTAQIPRAVAAYQGLAAGATAAARGFALFNVTATAGIAAIGIVAGLAAVELAFRDVEDSANDAGQAVGQSFGARLIELDPRIEDVGSRIRALKTSIDELDGPSPFKDTRLSQMREELAALEPEYAHLLEMAETARQGLDWEAEQRKLGEDAQKAADENEEAAARLAAAWQDSLGSTRQALAGLGIDLKHIGAATLQQMGQMGGALGSLAMQARGVQVAEEGVAKQMLNSTNPAIRAQATATRLKGETTEQLIDRLGLTTEQEAELTATGRIATEGIISQEEATRRATEAHQDWVSAQKDPSLASGVPGGAVWGPTGGGYSGGGGSPGHPPVGPTGDVWNPAWTGGAPGYGQPVSQVKAKPGETAYEPAAGSYGAYSGNADLWTAPGAIGAYTSGQFDAAAVGLRSERGRLTRDVQRLTDPGGSQQALINQDLFEVWLQEHPDYKGSGLTDAQYIRKLLMYRAKGLGGAAYPMKPTTDFLKSIGIIYAAEGYDGVVSRPTLFMAGEAGAERVHIKPGIQNDHGPYMLGGSNMTYVGPVNNPTPPDMLLPARFPSGGPVVHGGVHVSVSVYGNPEPQQVAAAARSGTLEALSLRQKRAASLRGF